jgi:hypothetical protein
VAVGTRTPLTACLRGVGQPEGETKVQGICEAMPSLR